MARNFWSGFAAGAAAGAGALFALTSLGRSRHRHVVRLEKSVQIGKPVEEVFRAWSNLENLPGMSHIVQSIRRSGERSHWVVTVNGRTFEWDASTEQLIPNQAIGWKSLSGPKHTGRIVFAPLGDDCLMVVTMNYAPPGNPLTRPFVQPIDGMIEEYIEQVLRDFKSALEGKGQIEHMRESATSRTMPSAIGSSMSQEQRATGTFGAAPSTPGHTSASTPGHTAPGHASTGTTAPGTPRSNVSQLGTPVGGAKSSTEGSGSTGRTNPLGVEPAPNPNPVDYTRPPESSYLANDPEDKSAK